MLHLNVSCEVQCLRVFERMNTVKYPSGTLAGNQFDTFGQNSTTQSRSKQLLFLRLLLNILNTINFWQTYLSPFAAIDSLV